MPLVEAIEAAQPHLHYFAHTLIARNATDNSTSSSASTANRPPAYKIIGLSLAVASGLFIGVSFVLKKVGLLRANVKYNEEAGEGYGYLKNAYWWGGMTLMIIGEICNFVAYAFTDAILVTPLGALSVVVTTILSAIFLKERLSFVGKVGCFNCIVGSVVIVMNAPEQSAVADIQEMQHFVIAPGFLSYAGVIIVGCVGIALWVAPRYGKKSMFVYLSICSFIGGLSVVATQGLGAAVVAQANKGHQFNQWFLYVLLVFVVGTLVTEIIYLNKALNLFNAALVTPTYYVFFTSTTIITSAVLFRGFHGTAIQITTVILGFLQICSGVVLLQLSKSAKDVPDAAVFKGDLSQVREVAEQEAAESEPKADAIRGTASIIRRISTPRMKMEQAEAKRFREEKMAEHLEPLKENEVAEWDGLRRRKTVIGQGPVSSPVGRRKTVHPPLGMSHFPTDESVEEFEQRDSHSFFDNVRQRTHTILHPRQGRHNTTDATGMQSPVHPVALTDIRINANKADSPIVPYGPGSLEEAQERIYGHPISKKNQPGPSPRSKPLPPQPSPSPGLDPGGLNVPGVGNSRQFSFSKFLRHSRQSEHSDTPARPSTATSHTQKKAMKNASEEERLGLVQGESRRALLDNSSPERTHLYDTDPYQYHHRLNSDDLDNSVYDNAYHFTRTQSTRKAHRSDSPDAMSDTDDSEDIWQRRAQDPVTPTHLNQHTPDFSFSSKGPDVLSTPQHQQQSSRRRPSPPKIYTPPPPQPPIHARNFAEPSSQDQGAPRPVATRRITLSNNNTGTGQAESSRTIPVLQPPVQFVPSQSRERTNTSSSSPTRTSPDRDRGRPLTSNFMPQEPPISGTSEDSSRSSKERFRDQSAREREERRQRAQNRQSMGKGGGPGGEII